MHVKFSNSFSKLRIAHYNVKHEIGTHTRISLANQRSIRDDMIEKWPCDGDFFGSVDHKCGETIQLTTHQPSSVWFWLTEAVTGNGELGFDSGEAA